MTTQNIEVSVTNYELPPITHGVCGDTGRVLTIKVKDYALTASMTAKVLALNADGLTYEAAGTINAEANTVTVPMNNMLLASGVTKCNLKITISGSDVQSFRFDVISHESAGNAPSGSTAAFFNVVFNLSPETSQEKAFPFEKGWTFSDFIASQYNPIVSSTNALLFSEDAAETGLVAYYGDYTIISGQGAVLLTDVISESSDYIVDFF